MTTNGIVTEIPMTQHFIIIISNLIHFKYVKFYEKFFFSPSNNNVFIYFFLGGDVGMHYARGPTEVSFRLLKWTRPLETMN